jgi:hypothetical protein
VSNENVHISGREALIALVRELQGKQTQVQFSARLGIEQSELSRFLRGERGATRLIILGLLRTFPRRRGEIVRAVLAAEPPRASVAA